MKEAQQQSLAPVTTTAEHAKYLVMRSVPHADPTLSIPNPTPEL